MKQIKLTTGEYLLVEVPEGQDYFDLYGNESMISIRYNTMPSPGKFKSVEVKLPPGQWQIIGRASELSEDNWDEIIESKWDDYADGFWWKIYDSDQDEWGMCPSESGLSLIKSHSMNPETTLVIRKIK